MKDFYAILGISVTAEKEVIEAAYKALVKKYHPDIYKGSKKTANDRIREINEAYETLSNKTKKTKYDKDFFKNENDKTGNFEDFQNSEFYEEGFTDNDWKTLIKFFPDAEKYRKELSIISNKIALVFQVMLIDKKLGHKSKKVYEQIKLDFFERYFGKNKKIHEIALMALIYKEKLLAKELNKDIALLGEGASEKIYRIHKNKINKAISLKTEKEEEKNRKKRKEEFRAKYGDKPYKMDHFQKFLTILLALLVSLVIFAFLTLL